MESLQQQVQEIAQKISKMDQHNTDHFTSLHGRITDSSAMVNTVRRGMDTDGERLVDMVLKKGGKIRKPDARGAIVSARSHAWFGHLALDGGHW